MSTLAGSLDYDRFDELAEEFAERYRRGERPNLQEYVDRLPEMADEIREMFPALIEVEQLEGDAQRVASSPTPAVSHLTKVGDYLLLREVGRGGMGVVYEAEQISLGRRVALKVLPGHVVGDRKTLERFRREAKAAARLHHTNIVPVFEVGSDRDIAFYAMQFIQGQGLDQVIDELFRLRDRDRKPSENRRSSSGFPLEPAIGIEPSSGVAARPRHSTLGQIAETLLIGRLGIEGLEGPVGAVSALAKSIIGAVKPFDPVATIYAGLPVKGRPLPDTPPAADVSSSAVLPGGTHVSVVDTSGRRQPYFRSVAQIGRQAAQGLAHAHARGVVHRDIKPSNLLLDTAGVVWITDFGLAKADDDGLTQTGDILGTIRYMAPERFRGQGDARADIYALGLTLYELLTLKPAYDSTDRLKLIEKVKNEEPVRPRLIDSRIPRDLETIVLKAIDKLPERRYQSAELMGEDLRRFLADEPIQARRVSSAERYARWARCNPAIAVLGGVLTGVLLLVTIGSLVVAGIYAQMADHAQKAAAAERSALQEASLQAKAEFKARMEADQARVAADRARAAALAETYRATLSEVRALRAGHQLGWREEALADLARLAVMPTPRRDLVELRTEAVASISEFEVKEVARLESSGGNASRLDFSPDSRTLVTGSANGDLDFWDIPSRSHLQRLVGVAVGGGYINSRYLQFLPDGDLAFLDPNRRVSFLGASGRPSARAAIESGTLKAMKLVIDRLGRSMAVGWDDGHLDILDTDTGALRQRHTWDQAGDFAFSSDGSWLAIQRRTGPIQLLATSGSGQGTPITLGDRKGSLLTFSPDGATLASIVDRSLVLLDVASKRELMTLGGHKESISSIAFSPDGALVATTCNDQMTRIWDARDGRALAVLPGPDWMNAVAFSPDGHYLVASSRDRYACLYQINGRRELRRLVGHKYGVQCLVGHPRLSRFATGSDDHAVIVWDTDKARLLRRWVPYQRWVTGLVYSSDGSLLASAQGSSTNLAEDHSIQIWDAETGTLRKVLPRVPVGGGVNGIEALAFDPTGGRLASGDEAGQILLWDVNKGQILRREKPGSAVVKSVAFVNDGRQLLVGQSDGTVVLFDLEGSSPPLRTRLPQGCYSLTVDGRGDRALVGDSDGGLSILTLPDLTVVHHLTNAHLGPIHALVLSPDGRLLATGGRDRHVVLRDPRTFEPWLTFPNSTGMVKDLAFDGSGRWLGYAGSESDVGLWDLGMVHDELASIGLAWDQPAPAVASAGHLDSVVETAKAQVPVIRPSTTDPAEFEKAQRLVTSGVEAFQQGRLLDAIQELQVASARLRTLSRINRNDDRLSSNLGISLGFLGSALRDSHRPVEALAAIREQRDVLESMRDPDFTDLYNLACGLAQLGLLLDHATTPPNSAERKALADRSMEVLRRSLATGKTNSALINRDHDLDPLRNRPDFRALILDRVFPRDPFAAPSPIQIHLPLKDPDRQELTRLNQQIASQPRSFDASLARAGFFARRRLWAEAVPDIRHAIELHPPSTWKEGEDTDLGMRAAALLLEAGDLDGYCRLARDMLDRFERSKSDMVLERTAKVNLLAQPPAEDLARVTGMADRAVKLGKSSGLLPYFHVARGMASYRAGEFTEATRWLRLSLESNLVEVYKATIRLYLAMSEHRLGHAEEARSLLAEARQTYTRSRATVAVLNAGWHDWLICEIALREAEALIDTATPRPAEPSARDQR